MGIALFVLVSTPVIACKNAFKVVGWVYILKSHEHKFIKVPDFKKLNHLICPGRRLDFIISIFFLKSSIWAVSVFWYESGLNLIQIFFNLPFTCRHLRLRITALNSPFSFFHSKACFLALQFFFCKNLICDFVLIISYMLPSNERIYVAQKGPWHIT